MSDSNDFQPVTFAKDRERVFQELGQKPVLVTAWTSGGRPLFFHVHSVEQNRVSLTVVEGDGADGSKGEIVEVLFSLDDGQYHLRSQIIEASRELWSVSSEGDLSRLQRRNNFRTTVPKGSKTVFRLTGMKTQTIQRTDLTLIDISAGGARVRWPSGGLIPPTEGDALSAQINTPGREIEVFGIVKSIRIDADSGETDVGVEFHNLSGRDEQALLQLCLQIRRQTAYVVR